MVINNKQNEEPGIISKALKVLAYPIAGYSGFAVTRNRIRHSTFMKLRREGGLDGVIKDHADELEKLTKETADAVYGSPSLKKDLVKILEPGNEAYTKAIREQLEGLGLSGLRKQSKYIYKQQFDKALIEGFSAAGISLGALLILANSRTLSHAFSHSEDKESGMAR